MSHSSVPLALALLGILVLAPLALAQDATHATPGFEDPAAPPLGTSRVVFYGHVFGSTLNEPMPANTQFPWGAEDYAGSIRDLTNPVLTCGPPPAATACEDHWVNKLVLFSTAGPVQVQRRVDFDYAALHNENGLSQDVLLDTTERVTASLHLSASYHAWLHNAGETPCLPTQPPENVPCLYPYWRWHSGVTPRVQVRAWLYAMVLGEHGEDASVAPPVRERWEGERGILVARGETPVVDVVSLDGFGGNERVWRFDIDLGEPLVDRIGREANLVLVYSWHEVTPDGTEALLGSQLRVNTGEFYPPTFSVPVKNAFMIELVHPRMLHERLIVVTVMNTPWGSYDVDPSSIRLTLRNAAGAVVPMPGLEAVADYSVAHGGHYRPINVTFVWDLRTAGLPAGTYTITAEASNFQGSATDSRVATIEIDAGGRLVRSEPGRAEIATHTSADVEEFFAGAGDGAGGSGRGVESHLDMGRGSLPDAAGAAIAPRERATVEAELLAVPVGGAVSALSGVLVAAVVMRNHVQRRLSSR